MGVFSSAKEIYNRKVEEFQRSGHNIVLTRYDFPKVYKQVHQHFKQNKALIQKGFRATGLCPLDVEAPMYDRLVTARIKNMESQTDEIEEREIAIQVDEEFKKKAETKITFSFGSAGVVATRPPSTLLKRPVKVRLLPSTPSTPKEVRTIRMNSYDLPGKT